ncbi:MAG: G5 domain-containing protein [Oscillospiraceae bacterium]
MKPQIVNAKMNRLIAKNQIIKLALFLMALAAVALMTGNLYFRDRVYITDNGVTREIMTSETDVYAILRSGDYTLGANDRITYVQGDESTAYITIHRAFDVIVNADGNTVAVPVIGGTAAQVLEKAGVELGQYDIADCELSDEVSEGMTINVTRISYNVRENTSEIPFETEYIDNSNLPIGTENVVTEGKNGVRTYFVKETYVDGKLSNQELTENVVTEEPVTQVIERGTALRTPYAKMDDPTALTLVDGLPESYTRVVSGKATAYTAGYGAKTASGRLAEIGTVAVNPNVIPYGSELYIVARDGSKVYGYAIAADTGLGLMDGTVAVDLYFGNRAEHYYDSCAWGAVYVDIYVLSEGNGR